MQKKSSLPPLKLPVNMQNEQRMENNSTNEKDETHRVDKISETSESNETQANLSENTSTKDSNIIDDSSTRNEKVPSPQKSSGTAPSEISREKLEEPRSIGDEIQPGDKGDAQDIESTGNEESNKSSQPDNENTEVTAEDSHAAASRIQPDETEQNTSTTSIPPPKPPRLKSASVEEDTSNEKESSSKGEDGGEAGKEMGEKIEGTRDEQNSTSPRSSDGKRPTSVISKNSHERTDMEAIENSIEKVEEDGHADESEKAETDGTQDDADVIQSPAPRTGWLKNQDFCAFFLLKEKN